MSVLRIVKITYKIYQELSKIRLCKKYVGRKVNSASKGLDVICTEILPLHVNSLTIQLETQHLVGGQQTRGLNEFPQYSYVSLVSRYLVLAAVS